MSEDWDGLCRVKDICACSMAADLGNSKFARDGDGDGNVAERCRGLALRTVPE